MTSRYSKGRAASRKRNGAPPANGPSQQSRHQHQEKPSPHRPHGGPSVSTAQASQSLGRPILTALPGFQSGEHLPQNLYRELRYMLLFRAWWNQEHLSSSLADRQNPLVTNLIILFRMLIFYRDAPPGATLWNQISTACGFGEDKAEYFPLVVRYYQDARSNWTNSNHDHFPYLCLPLCPLLLRLVDAYTRYRNDRPSNQTWSAQEWASRHRSWMHIQRHGLAHLFDPTVQDADVDALHTHERMITPVDPQGQAQSARTAGPSHIKLREKVRHSAAHDYFQTNTNTHPSPSPTMAMPSLSMHKTYFDDPASDHGANGAKEGAPTANMSSGSFVPVVEKTRPISISSESEGDSVPDTSHPRGADNASSPSENRRRRVKGEKRERQHDRVIANVGKEKKRQMKEDQERQKDGSARQNPSQQHKDPDTGAAKDNSDSEGAGSRMSETAARKALHFLTRATAKSEQTEQQVAGVAACLQRVQGRWDDWNEQLRRGSTMVPRIQSYTGSNRPSLQPRIEDLEAESASMKRQFQDFSKTLGHCLNEFQEAQQSFVKAHLGMSSALRKVAEVLGDRIIEESQKPANDQVCSLKNRGVKRKGATSSRVADQAGSERRVEEEEATARNEKQSRTKR